MSKAPANQRLSDDDLESIRQSPRQATVQEVEDMADELLIWREPQLSEANSTRDILCRAAGWLAAPEGESRKSTVALIQELVAEVKRLSADSTKTAGVLGKEPEGMLHPCNCTGYNGGQCYNCLNGFHVGCTAGCTGSSRAAATAG